MEELKRIPLNIKPAPKKGEHHAGFKTLLINKSYEKGLTYLRRIAKSVYFTEVEKALNQSGKGRGMGKHIDHETLIDAVIKAHKVYKDKKTTAPKLLEDKIKKHNEALKLADDLVKIMEALGIKKGEGGIGLGFNSRAASGLGFNVGAASRNHSVDHYQNIHEIVTILKIRKADITDNHDQTKICSSVNKTEGLTNEQAIFIRWLYIYLAIDYPGKLFSSLIASVVSCFFKEEITPETVKSNLVGARKSLDEQVNRLKDRKKIIYKTLKECLK
ncbi:MAG: hypothetical protein WCP96_09960 [Methylococcaceae bacterium]